MTNREFLNAVINANIDDETTDYAKSALAKLDATNEKRRNTPSKTQEANAPLMDQIVTSILTAEPKTASDVAGELGVSVQKASALLRQMVENGTLVAEEIKVPKKGKVKSYSLAK